MAFALNRDLPVGRNRASVLGKVVDDLLVTQDSLDQVLGVVQQGGADNHGDGPQGGDDDHNLQGAAACLAGSPFLFHCFGSAFFGFVRRYRRLRLPLLSSVGCRMSGYRICRLRTAGSKAVSRTAARSSVIGIMSFRFCCSSFLRAALRCSVQQDEACKSSSCRISGLPPDS